MVPSSTCCGTLGKLLNFSDPHVCPLRKQRKRCFLDGFDVKIKSLASRLSVRKCSANEMRATMRLPWWYFSSGYPEPRVLEVELTYRERVAGVPAESVRRWRAGSRKTCIIQIGLQLIPHFAKCHQRSGLRGAQLVTGVTFCLVRQGWSEARRTKNPLSLVLDFQGSRAEHLLLSSGCPARTEGMRPDGSKPVRWL